MEEVERQMFGIMGYILRKVIVLTDSMTYRKEILSFCLHGTQNVSERAHKGVESFLNTLNTKKKHSKI